LHGLINEEPRRKNIKKNSAIVAEIKKFFVILHPDLQGKTRRFIVYIMDIIRELQADLAEIKDFPKFSSGDTVIVSYKIKEGAKERIQQFTGVVLQRRGSGATETFTVRKMSGNIGVERIFPIASPFLDEIKVTKVGYVRRARIFYFRGLTGKAARIREKRSYVKS
jgi:large subunit ribosomal protein L19